LGLGDSTQPTHAIPVDYFNSLRKQVYWLINNKRVFSFSSSDIKVHVPPKGIGDPPERTATVDMEASSDYVHSLPFCEDVYYHSNGLTDTRAIDKTNNTGPGLHYVWNLKNSHYTPVTGRTANMKVNLLVKRRPDYEISTPGFSPVYNAIRDRFFEHFFHSGFIAQNYWPNEKKLKFSDQPLYMGQTLIMLSSEFYILKLRRESGEASKIVGLINTVLDAIENNLVDPASNGYIIRDSIIGKDDPLLPSGKYREVLSDFQNGRDNEISIDNYIGLMVGLMHISKYLDQNTDESRNASSKATQFIKRFFKYLMSRKFRVERPDGARVKRGDDAQGFVTLLHGLYKKATSDDVFDELKIDLDIGGHEAVKWVGSVWDAGGLLSSLLPLLGQSVNAFTMHMAFSLLCSSEVWAQQELENASNKNHLLSIILYAYYHNTGAMGVPWSDVRQLLLRCDERGPSNKQEFWNQDNIWVRGGSGNRSDEGEEFYNGLDYMVLHNLAQIVYQKNFHR